MKSNTELRQTTPLIKSNIINYVIGIILIIYCLSSIKNSYLEIVIKRNGWYLGEWLINYQDGGFKRRGFFGTFFIFINELTRIKLEYIVFTFVTLLYISFFTLLARLFLKNYNNLLVVALLLLPAGFGMILKDPAISAKKDIFFMFLYLLWFISLQSKIAVNNFVISIFIIISILNHEVSFFYIPFIVFTYFIKNKDISVPDRFIKAIIFIIIPATLTIITLYIFGLNIRTDNSILFLKRHGLTLKHLGIYQYDPNYNVLSFLKAHFYGYQNYIIAILLAFNTFYFYCKLNCIKFNYRFLILQITFMFPLFCMAYDWGRWINIFFSLLTIYVAGKNRLIITKKRYI